MKLKLILSLFSLFLIFSVYAQEKPDPSETEVWEPVPEKIEPGKKKQAPSDAIILFDGNDLSAWESSKDGSKAPWKIKGNHFTVVPKSGSIQTKQAFGDVQLHIEFRCPKSDTDEGQGKGNSGVFFMGQYEVQVLDCYNNNTYSNGQTASIYKQHIPLVNACRKPGKWQTYDIIFMAPEFDNNGDVKKPAYLTVFHNGVLVQNHAEVKGITVFRGKPYYKKHPDKLPLSLQDHGDLVSYRNIWIREL